MCTQAVSSFPLLRSPALDCDPEGQRGCSFHSGFAVLSGNGRDLRTVRFGAHQQHLKLLGAVDQELPKATGQHVLVFLLLPQPTLGIEAWPLGLLHIPLSVPLGFRQ